MFGAASLLIIGIVGAVAVNFGVIRDFFVGLSYAPTEEMAEIRESLSLSSEGMRIFNAVQPELMERAEFNEKCRELENQSAILGCYTEDRVYVFNIVDDELEGIRELTAAHELLHAVYFRMSESEQVEWGLILNEVYADNLGVLGSELAIYDEDERREELYVRAGTEILDLPEALENHYGRIFENRGEIVKYYEEYIAVFKELEAKIASLYEKTEALEAEINSKTTDYETRAKALNEAAREFNECARVLNCFSSQADFYARRAEIMGEQESLKNLYEELNRLIDEYNALVTEYNENVLHGQMLNTRINSGVKIEE